MTQLYTPFMAQAGQKIGSALAQKAQNKLLGSAYMGQPGAMQQLMQVNPQAAMQLQQQRQQQEQQQLQKQAAQQKARQQVAMKNKGLIDEVIKNTAKFESYPEAKDYFDSEKKRYASIFNTPETGDMLSDAELTERGFLQAKQMYADDVGGMASAKTQIFDNGTTVALLPDGSTQVTNPAGEVVEGKQRTETLKLAREEQLGFAGKKEKVKAEGKAEGEAAAAPLIAATKSQIEKAVSLAKSEAKSRGETITELQQAKAALPGLNDAVGQLKELALIGTYTTAGRVFDAASKELGFGSTKGATARAKFSAIVDNQVLPLLKQTFGAAFTVKEGEWLRATMGDINATPEAKMAQLEAFIDAKVRGIETKERKLSADETVTSQEPVLSDEELVNKYAQ